MKKKQLNQGPVPHLHYCSGYMDNKTFELEYNIYIFESSIHCGVDIDINAHNEINGTRIPIQNMVMTSTFTAICHPGI